MKIHILSDLHTEFSDFDPPETDPDVVDDCGAKWIVVKIKRHAEKKDPPKTKTPTQPKGHSDKHKKNVGVRGRKKKKKKT